MIEQIGKYPPLISFKHDNLKAEFEDPQLDNRLKIIIYALAGFVYFNFGKNLTLTEIFRTQEMQDQYYKDDPIYKQKPFFSTHQLWRAADISVIYFTKNEIDQISKFLSLFDYGDKIHSTYLIHNIGLGEHLHLQCPDLGYKVTIKIS